jgi:Zn-dependent oligopeptidase
MTLANNRIAKSPEMVRSFLEELSTKLKGKAEQEMSILRKEKMLQENSSAIYGWDSSYYMGLTKAKRYSTHIAHLYIIMAYCITGTT